MEVKRCKECPVRKHHVGHGENWDYCAAPDAPEGYGNIIPRGEIGREDASLFPGWCPLPLTITRT